MELKTKIGKRMQETISVQEFIDHWEKLSEKIEKSIITQERAILIMHDFELGRTYLEMYTPKSIEVPLLGISGIESETNRVFFQLNNVESKLKVALAIAVSRCPKEDKVDLGLILFALFLTVATILIFKIINIPLDSSYGFGILLLWFVGLKIINSFKIGPKGDLSVNGNVKDIKKQS